LEVGSKEADNKLKMNGRKKRRRRSVKCVIMAATSSIITFSSSSLFTPTTPQPKPHCLLKHTKDNDHLPPSSFSTLSSLRIISRRPFGRLNVPPRRFTCSASASSSSTLPSALLFDCDGVLVDTEKDGHRISFNQTFQEVLHIQTLITYAYTLFPFRILLELLLNSLLLHSTMLYDATFLSVDINLI